MRAAPAAPALRLSRLPRVRLSIARTAIATRWSLVAAGATLPYALAHWV